MTNQTQKNSAEQRALLTHYSGAGQTLYYSESKQNYSLQPIDSSKIISETGRKIVSELERIASIQGAITADITIGRAETFQDKRKMEEYNITFGDYRRGFFPQFTICFGFQERNPTFCDNENGVPLTVYQHLDKQSQRLHYEEGLPDKTQIKSAMGRHFVDILEKVASMPRTQFITALIEAKNSQ